jgi:hypothetical protein
MTTQPAILVLADGNVFMVKLLEKLEPLLVRSVLILG